VQHSQPAAQSQAQSVHSSHCPPEQQPALRFAGREASATVASTTPEAASSASSAEVSADFSQHADLVFATADLAAQQAAGLVATLVVADSFAAQQTQAQPSLHRQTPVSQHWQPATQSHSQFVHNLQEPPEQHWLASLAPLDALPADITNPNADTPVSARNIMSLVMVLNFRRE
jgi:hypothetical protein